MTAAQLERITQELLRESFANRQRWLKVFRALVVPFWQHHFSRIPDYPRARAVLGQKVESKFIELVKPLPHQIIRLLLEILTTPELFPLFRQGLSDDVRAVFDHMVWNPYSTPQQILDELGVNVLDEQRVQHDFHWLQTPWPLPEYQLYIVQPFHLDERHGSEEVILEMHLHPELRSYLMEQYEEKPEHYELRAVEEVPSELIIFEDEGSIIHLLPALRLYHQQGNIKTGKTGKPNANTFRSMHKRLGFQEFYPPEEKLLQHLRTAMLATLMVQEKVERAPSLMGAAYLKQLFTKYYLDPQVSFPHLHLLYYLKGQVNIEAYELVSYQRLVTFMIEQLPQGKWQHVEQLYQWLHMRGYETGFVSIDLAMRYLSYSSSWGSEPLRYDLLDHQLSRASLKGSLALLAAFGLIDIAYSQPDTRQPGLSFYSPFDGLAFFRLTPLGAYVFGLTETYVPPPPAASGREVYILSPHSLILRLSDKAKEIDRLRLQPFVESLGNDSYKLTYASFLGTCQRPEDVPVQVDVFQRLIGGQLFPIWKQFFDGLSQRMHPLAQVPNVHVYQLPDDPELLRHVAQDEVLRTLVQKAEGYQILVARKDLPALKKRLQVLGYLM